MSLDLLDTAGWIPPLYGHTEAHSDGQVVGIVWGIANQLVLTRGGNIHADTCGYTDLLATGPDRFVIVYSDFHHRDKQGRERVVSTRKKKVKGRKRHLLVDTLGLVLTCVVHAASVQDRDGAKLLRPVSFWYPAPGLARCEKPHQKARKPSGRAPILTH